MPYAAGSSGIGLWRPLVTRLRACTGRATYAKASQHQPKPFQIHHIIASKSNKHVISCITESLKMSTAHAPTRHTGSTHAPPAPSGCPLSASDGLDCSCMHWKNIRQALPFSGASVKADGPGRLGACRTPQQHRPVPKQQKREFVALRFALQQRCRQQCPRGATGAGAAQAAGCRQPCRVHAA